MLKRLRVRLQSKHLYIDGHSRSASAVTTDRRSSPPSHGGMRLHDSPSRLRSFGQRLGSRSFWLLPSLMFAGVAVALMLATGNLRSSIDTCDIARELRIEWAKSCRNIVWVKSKSSTIVKPIAIAPKQQRKQRRS
jgi:hypothetical protein